MIYLDNQNNFKKDIVNIQNKYIQTNKELIKNEVDRVHTYIQHEKNSSKNNLNTYLKEHVYEAYGIIERTYKRNIHLPEKEILRKINLQLRDLRYNSKKGYFFIYSLTGDNILHPILPKLEGKNMINYQDAKGTFLLKEMRRILSNKKETYYDWYWYKPNNEKEQFKKTGFFKKFAPLNLFVGTGEYIDDYEQDLQSNILTYTPKIKFSNDGFIFIIDYKGNMISHPNISLVGKNVLQAKDRFDTKFVQQMVSIAKKGDGYINYSAPSISMDSQHLKTSYIKGFNEWGWLIGAGFYQNQIYSTIIERNKELKKINNKYLITMLVVSLVSTTILLGLSMILSHNIQRKFLEYKKKILEETKKNREKDHMLSQQSKMAAMGEMLANVAHQWRQPLSAISTSSSGLKIKHQLGVLKDGDIEQTTDNITKYTQYLSKTLENFKNFFKPTQECTKFNMEQTIDKTLDIFSAQIRKHQISIIKEIEPISLIATENDFMQVIMNLIHNSRDVLISRHIHNKVIFITVLQEKEEIVIKIRDNAGGIKEDIIDRIFEPYFTTKHQSQGTGIGLYMTKEIIMKHMNSSITAQNSTFVHEGQEYVGAEFIIRLKKT